MRSVWDTQDLASEREEERKKKRKGGREGGGRQPDVLAHACNLSPCEAEMFKASLEHLRKQCLKCGDRESNEITGQIFLTQTA